MARRKPVRRGAVRIQRRIRGGREGLPATVMKSIRRAVEWEAARYNVSKSFVVATRLARSFGITDQEDYEERSRS